MASVSGSSVDGSVKPVSTAYRFDTLASPEQKKEALLSLAPSGLKTHRDNRAGEIVSDLQSRPTLSMPVPNGSGISAQVSAAQNQRGPSRDLQEAKIGWEMAGGSSRSELAQFVKDEESGAQNSSTQVIDHQSADHQTELEKHLPASAFGDWYHNTGIIIFSALSCWIIGRCGGGLAWLILVLAICGTYYRTSIRRVRRNVRDDLTRQLAKSKLENDTESAEWINSFLSKFWVIYEPVLSATIVASVDQVLATTTPAFLDSMRLSFFTLGTKPPRIDEVKTYPKTEDDIVLMDWRFSFTPNDTEDLTARQMRNKINPKIELAIRAGISVAAVNIPVIVEDIAFSGLMQVRIKLTTEFPHIKIVDLSFLEKPDLAYVLKPIGGSSLGFDVGFIPGLSGWILDMIHSSLAPMMYAPNVFTLNIQQMLSGAPIDSAIGVAIVTIHDAHGLRNPDIGSGTPDPYVSLNVGHGELARTKTVRSETDPRFDETKTLLLTTLNDPLSFEVFDYNEVRKDKCLGTATFNLKNLEEDSEQERIHESIMLNGKPRGSINFSISWFPVMAAPLLEDGSAVTVPESNAGIVRFTLHQAKGLSSGKNINPYGILTMDSKQVAKSPKMKRTQNPVWDFSKEILVTDKAKCVLGVQIRTDELGGDQLLGAHSIKLVDLLKNNADEIDDFMLSNTKTSSSKVKLTATWKPISMTGLPTSTTYVAPIGALKIEFKRAAGLRNPELGLTGGKADPYMRVMANGRERARTVTIKNEQNPVWNEIVYVPIKSSRERIVLEVMDYQARTKDRSLGSIDLLLVDLIQQHPDGTYAELVEQQLRSSTFHGKDAKGTLEYKIAFFPSINVMSLEEEQEADKPIKDAAVLDTAIAPSVSSSNPVLEALADGKAAESHNRTTSNSTTTTKRTIRASKIRLAREEIQQYQSGFIVFDLIQGKLPQAGCYLQVLLDDYLYPSYTTSRTRSKHAKWNETGEGLVRELDVSKMTLRINKEADSHDLDHILAQFSDYTLNVIRYSFNEAVTRTLKSNDGQAFEISFQCRWIPVPLQLEARESVNNMGNLRVSILSGHKLCAADRGNKSDPYAKFFINTQEDCIYKTETIKKTLNPEWNETFECSISSRIENILHLNVFDWDAIGEDDDLGTAVVPLTALEPLTSQTIELPLHGPKGGEGKSGYVKLQLLFTPGFITRARRGSTTRALTMATGVASAPAKLVGVGLGAGFSGVKKTGSFLGKGIGLGHKHAEKSTEILPTTNGGVQVKDGNPPDFDNTNNSRTAIQPGAADRQRSDSFQGHMTSNGKMPDPSSQMDSNFNMVAPPTPLNVPEGQLILRLIDGQNFPVDKKTLVKIRSKSSVSIGKTDMMKQVNPEFNSEFKAVISLPDVLEFSLYEHSTFGSDKFISDAALPVSEQTTNGSPIVVRFDNGTSISIEMRFALAEVASLRSHRGLKLGSPFRKASQARG